MSEKFMRCWACGRLYRFYAHMVGDQTLCPHCRDKAKQEADQ